MKTQFSIVFFLHLDIYIFNFLSSFIFYQVRNANKEIHMHRKIRNKRIRKAKDYWFYTNSHLEMEMWGGNMFNITLFQSSTGYCLIRGFSVLLSTLDRKVNTCRSLLLLKNNTKIHQFESKRTWQFLYKVACTLLLLTWPWQIRSASPSWLYLWR